MGGHYSHAVRAGDFVFIAGQTPRNERREVVGTTIAEQTAAVMANVESVLAAAGASLDQVVKVNVYLAELSDAPRFDEVYRRSFPDWAPARTTIGCRLNGVLIEVDAVAFVGARD